MRQVLILLLVFGVALGGISCGQAQGDSSQPKIMVFSKTASFRHESIPTGIKAVKKLSRENGYQVVATEDSQRFNKDTLATYDAIIILNTTGNVFNEAQQKAFKAFVQAGGGVVGVHAASDTEFEWPWYGRMIGAYFVDHPAIQEATIKVVNHDHPATAHLSDQWVRTDEWYNYRNIQDDLHVLAYLDESSYEGGTNGAEHPFAWYHEFDGGRIFYTGGGHTNESYSEPAFMQHLLGGIEYVLGEK